MYYCCDRRDRAASAQKIHTVAASSNRNHPPRSLCLIAFSRHVLMGAILPAHTVHGESCIHRKANQEVQHY